MKASSLRVFVVTCSMGVALAGMAAPAAAAEGSVAVGVSAGTLGVGPELSFRFNEHVGVRLGGSFFDYEDDDELDDVEYEADLKLNSIGATLDWYPAGGGFRVSAGARINNNKIGLLGTPTGTVEIGDVEYTPAEVGSLSGTIKTKSIAPVFSIGYGGKLAPGFTLGFELGVYMQGSPRLESLTASGTLGSNSAFLTQLAEEERRIEEDADDYKLWPIIQLQLMYRF